MRRVLCAIVLAVLCQRVALAQDTVQARLPASPAPSHKPSRPHRSGLWGELGFGPGYVRIGCSGCTDVIGANGGTSYVRIGGVLSDHALIGVELFSFLDKGFGFSAQDSSTTAETGTLAVIILWYPGRHGLFFKGGVGAAYGAFSIPQDTAGVVTADTSNGGGIGLTFGLGWDTPISRKFAFTGNAAVFVTAVGDVVFPGRRVDDVIATMYQLSIGFTFR